ncbi:hypothetical protein GY45DRAFT_1330309 [Cubamyces sp. BRFM 1775]|nr:hypothetical protein GY45DRAFT_1330309 [Cubamyces sp. BRFM 1775]
MRVQVLLAHLLQVLGSGARRMPSNNGAEKPVVLVTTDDAFRRSLTKPFRGATITNILQDTSLPSFLRMQCRGTADDRVRVRRIWASNVHLLCRQQRRRCESDAHISYRYCATGSRHVATRYAVT